MNSVNEFLDYLGKTDNPLFVVLLFAAVSTVFLLLTISIFINWKLTLLALFAILCYLTRRAWKEFKESKKNE